MSIIDLQIFVARIQQVAAHDPLEAERRLSEIMSPALARETADYFHLAALTKAQA